MKITVCIKQVPDTADIQWTEHNTLCRDGVESILNPCDSYAVDSALQIKDKNENVHITAISMGPLQAEKTIREVIATGVDDGILLNDKFFAGSDTASTARVLAQAVKSKLSDTNLILCGQYASDGDTAQTGPSLAQNLGFGIVTNVVKIENIEENSLTVIKQTDDGKEKIQVFLPAVICLQKGRYETRLPKISGRIKAKNAQIPVYNALDIDINAETTGFKGSPTHVKKAFKPEGRQNCQLLVDKNSNEIRDKILELLNEIKKAENE